METQKTFEINGTCAAELLEMVKELASLFKCSLTIEGEGKSLPSYRITTSCPIAASAMRSAKRLVETLAS